MHADSVRAEVGTIGAPNSCIEPSRTITCVRPRRSSARRLGRPRDGSGAPHSPSRTACPGSSADAQTNRNGTPSARSQQHVRRVRATASLTPYPKTTTQAKKINASYSLASTYRLHSGLRDTPQQHANRPRTWACSNAIAAPRGGSQLAISDSSLAGSELRSSLKGCN